MVPAGPYTISDVSAEACNAGGFYDRFFTAIIDPPITTSGMFSMVIVGEIQDLCTNASIAGADTLYFEVETNPFTPDVADITVCPSGGSTDIVVNGNGTYYFYSIDGVSPDNLLHTGNVFDPLPHVQPDAAFQFLATEVVAGCESIADTVNVVVGSEQNADFSIEPEICLEGLSGNPAVQLDASATSGGLFFMQPDNHAINANTGEIEIDNISPDVTYSIFYGTPGICQLIESREVVFLENPIAEFTADASVCTGQASNISFTGSAGSSAQFNWDFGDGSIVSGSGEGPYQVNWSNAGEKTISLSIQNASGCASEVFEEIVTVSEFNVNTGPDVNISLGGSKSLYSEIIGSTSGAVSYEWTPAEGLDCTDCPLPVASPANNTEYTVIATDEAGCSSSAAVLVNVDRNSVTVPTAFSPNGDNVNDHFRIVGSALQAASVIVYNRWGIKVYENPDFLFAKGWDGTHNNEAQPTGTYVYAINVRFEDGRERLLKGSFLLVR